MDIKDLKIKIEKLYSRIISSNLQQSESVVLIDAVKSLLGINIESPCVNLVKWLENQFSDDAKYDNLANLRESEIPEVVSFVNLRLSLFEKNQEQVDKNLFLLSRVSDGKQIIEFLLEFSIENCNYESHLYIWSIYRMELFLGNKYMDNSLRKCCYSIMLNFVEKDRDLNLTISKDWLEKFNNVNNSFNEISLYYSIYNSDLVRQNKINSLILKLITKYKSHSLSGNLLETSKSQILNRRNWILNYIDCNIGKLSHSDILFLNNARACLQFSGDKKFDLVIWSRINNMILK